MAHRKMLVAVFRDRVNAQTAYDRLVRRGYTNSEINVLMSDTTRATYFSGDKGQEIHNVGSLATEGLGVGSAIGTAVGAGLAAAVAIGTGVMIPGIGWVAGPIIAALAGGGAGAVAGGLIGTLIGLGIPESNAKAYEEALKEGGVIIGVAPRTGDDADAIKEEFQNLNGENITFA